MDMVVDDFLSGNSRLALRSNKFHKIRGAKQKDIGVVKDSKKFARIQ
jgi:hypothetical protein